MSARQVSAVVRNPLLGLPAIGELQELDQASREALRAVLVNLRDDCRARAEKAWRTHKAPMAAYWKAVAVYANHTARILK